MIVLQAIFWITVYVVGSYLGFQILKIIYPGRYRERRRKFDPSGSRLREIYERSNSAKQKE